MSKQNSDIAATSIDQPNRVSGTLLEAKNLNRTGLKNGPQLQDVSLYVRYGEVVALAGLSKMDRNALVDALSGRRPVKEGQVLVAGTNLYQNLKAVRQSIGFVPQQDGLHRELTVEEELNYAARLRLPRGMPAKMRRQRVEEVLEALELSGLRRRKAGALNAGERKRLSTGLELLRNPLLLFLDEPTTGMDPVEEARTMQILHRLADQGRAVLLSTSSTESMQRADRLLILAEGGALGWFGPPDEALAYFEAYHSEPGLVERPARLEEIFTLLEDPDRGNPQEWAERYRSHPAYKKYLSAPLKGKKPDMLLEERPLARRKEKAAEESIPPSVEKSSGLRQFLALSGRNLKLLGRDRVSLFLALAAPLVAASFELLLVDAYLYDPLLGDATRIMLSLAVLVFIAMTVAGIAMAREIVKEREAYQRERQAGLKLVPYALSKVWIVGLLALYQGLVWTAIHFILVAIPGGMSAALSFYITLVLAILAGGLLGLIASALARSEAAPALLFIFFVLPQLIFSGALFPVSRLNPLGTALASIMPSRFAFEALVTATGVGSAVVSDICWNLPEEERKALTDVQKQACTCLGINIFSQCNFPGIWRFYHPALDQPSPARPEFDNAANRLPAQPILRPGQTLEEYANEVNAYTLQIEANRASSDSYVARLRQYMSDLADWESHRNLAIGSAEGQIEVEYSNFGPIFRVNLASHWLALLIANLVFIAILMGIQKGKDVI